MSANRRRSRQRNNDGASSTENGGQAWIAVGEIVGAFGIRGEVKALPQTDFPERFAQTPILYLGDARAPHAVQSARQHQRIVILKLAGVDDMTTAARLRGVTLWIPEAERMPLPADQFYLSDVMEDVALWHERDISHSSVERMIGPDATVALDFALARLTGIVDKLIVYPSNMQKNMDRLGGLIHSQRVLIALTQKGVAREDAYRLVQRNAMKVWSGQESDFLKLLKADPEVKAKLSDKELEANFNLDHHFQHVDTIFERVFGTS